MQSANWSKLSKSFKIYNYDFQVAKTQHWKLLSTHLKTKKHTLVVLFIASYGRSKSTQPRKLTLWSTGFQNDAVLRAAWLWGQGKWCQVNQNQNWKGVEMNENKWCNERNGMTIVNTYGMKQAQALCHLKQYMRGKSAQRIHDTSEMESYSWIVQLICQLLPANPLDMRGTVNIISMTGQ